MSIVLIVIAILIIWFVWGLNNKNKTADKVASMGGMRVVYATLINEYLLIGGQITAEKKDAVSLVVHGEYIDSPSYWINIVQNFDEVSIAVVAATPVLGLGTKVQRLFSFPVGMDQHLMVSQIRETMERLIAEKMKM